MCVINRPKLKLADFLSVAHVRRFSLIKVNGDWIWQIIIIIHNRFDEFAPSKIVQFNHNQYFGSRSYAKTVTQILIPTM